MEKAKKFIQMWSENKAAPYIFNSVVFIIFITVAFTVYFPSIEGPFVLDDIRNIYRNSAISMTKLSFAALKKAASESATPTRPVANISFALNNLYGQNNATGFRVVNILIHATTGFILYLFFRITLQINGSTEKNKHLYLLSFVAAMIWLVHPLQTQAVAYIVQRMTSMSAMFYIMSMLLYVYGRITCHQWKMMLLFGGSLLAALLSLGSKEIAATLPLFIFLYEWFFFQNLKWIWLKKRVIYFSLVIGYFVFIALTYLGPDPIDRIMSTYQDRYFTLAQRVLTEFRVLIIYIGEILFPHPSRLSLEHDISLSYSLFSPTTTFFSAAILFALLYAAIRLAKRERLISFAIIWYLGNLIIESSVIGLEIIFEHRNYLPSMLFILMLVYLTDRFVNYRRAKTVIACLVIVFCSLWTYERSATWADAETLHRDSINKAPNKYRPYFNLAVILSSQGKYNETIDIYQQSKQVYLKDKSAQKSKQLFFDKLAGRSYTTKGNALSRKGKFNEGNNLFNQAIQLNPEDANAYIGLGNNSSMQKQYSKAIGYYKKALLLTNDSEAVFAAEFGLGTALHQKGLLKEALKHYNIALQIQPGSNQLKGVIYELQKKVNSKQ